MYATSIIVSKYVRQTDKLQGEINTSTPIVGRFQNPFFSNRSSRQKISKDIEDWNTMDQLELIDIYGIILVVCPVDSKIYVYIKTCIRMFITVFFIIALNRKQLSCLSVGVWINKFETFIQ